MSDDEEYYDDDDYFYIDEGPVADAVGSLTQPSPVHVGSLSLAKANTHLQDDFAEHTMHSPVWQEHPSDDTAEYWSDWDYYSDDYYDQGSPKRKRQRIVGEGVTETKAKDVKSTQAGKRNRNLRRTEDIPELSLGESLDSDMEESVEAKPTVVWRLKEAHGPVEYPIVTEGKGETVALLRDWRERFEAVRKPGQNTAADKDLKSQKPNRTAVAVVIGPSPSERATSGATTPTMSSRARNVPSRSKPAPGHANGASISKPSTAKAKAAITNTTNGIKPPATTNKSSRGTAVLGQRANEVETIGKKRTRPGADEGVTTDGDETIPRKRRTVATKEKENEAVQSAAQSDDSSISGRKRKAPDDDDETITPQAVKRKTSAPKATSGASEPKKGSAVPIGRNTRSKRG